jgi:aryl-alcohol dehydrogenase-like predicted oxidoreductase
VAVALSWVLTTPGVTATVVGASSVEQLDQVVAYAERPFDRSEMSAVDAAYAYRPSKGHG